MQDLAQKYSNLPVRRQVDAPVPVAPLIHDVTTDEKHLLDPSLLACVITAQEGEVDEAGRCASRSSPYRRPLFTRSMCVSGCKGNAA